MPRFEQEMKKMRAKIEENDRNQQVEKVYRERVDLWVLENRGVK